MRFVCSFLFPSCFCLCSTWSDSLLYVCSHSGSLHLMHALSRFLTDCCNGGLAHLANIVGHPTALLIYDCLYSLFFEVSLRLWGDSININGDGRYNKMDNVRIRGCAIILLSPLHRYRIQQGWIVFIIKYISCMCASLRKYPDVLRCLRVVHLHSCSSLPISFSLSPSSLFVRVCTCACSCR